MRLKKIIRSVCMITASVLMCTSFVSCSVGNDSEPSVSYDLFDESSSSGGESEGIEKTGEFVVTLDPENAPITCENFEKLVKDGFYNGLTFHRVIDGFMAQGGDPKGNGTGGSDETIKGEFSANGVDNKLSHTRGVISMARGSNDMNSASSQFFICYSDAYTSSLDGQYASFGKVTEGMETVDDFLNVERSYNEMGELATPVKPITIKTAEMTDDDSEGHHRVKFTVSYTVKAESSSEQ